MKHLIAIALIAFLFPAAAAAEEPAAQKPAAAKAAGPCKEDRTKFCPGKDAKKVRDCLKTHVAELSTACKAQLEKIAAKKKAAAEKSTAPTNSAAPVAQASTPGTPE